MTKPAPQTEATTKTPAEIAYDNAMQNWLKARADGYNVTFYTTNLLGGVASLAVLAGSLTGLAIPVVGAAVAAAPLLAAGGAAVLLVGSAASLFRGRDTTARDAEGSYTNQRPANNEAFHPISGAAKGLWYGLKQSFVGWLPLTVGEYVGKPVLTAITLIADKKTPATDTKDPSYKRVVAKHEDAGRQGTRLGILINSIALPTAVVGALLPFAAFTWSVAPLLAIAGIAATVIGALGSIDKQKDKATDFVARNMFNLSTTRDGYLERNSTRDNASLRSSFWLAFGAATRYGFFGRVVESTFDAVKKLPVKALVGVVQSLFKKGYKPEAVKAPTAPAAAALAPMAQAAAPVAEAAPVAPAADAAANAPDNKPAIKGPVAGNRNEL